MLPRSLKDDAPWESNRFLPLKKESDGPIVPNTGRWSWKTSFGAESYNPWGERDVPGG